MYCLVEYYSVYISFKFRQVKSWGGSRKVEDVDEYS